MAERGAVAENFWDTTLTRAVSYPTIEADHRAEFCIIGAGYTGLSAAIRLAAAGRSVVVLEADQPGAGASGRNTGWWLPLWSFTTPTQLTRRLGPDQARALASLMVEGGTLVPDLVRRYGIECDLRVNGVVMLARSSATLRKLEALRQDWASHGNSLHVLDKAGARHHVQSDFYNGGLFIPQAGQLNPLAFCLGLADAACREGAKVYGNSRAIALADDALGVTVTTSMGRVRADKVLLATDAYATDFAGLPQSFVSVRIGMLGSAALADHGAAYVRDAPFTDMDSGDAFAVGFSADGRLVTSILPGWNKEVDPATAAMPFWRKFRRVFPHAPERLDWEYAWSGAVAIPKDRFVKLYEVNPRVLACLGYSGNGIAQAAMAGHDVAELMMFGEASGCRVPLSAPVPWPGARMLSSVINRIVLPAAGSVVYR
jgi:glycine/D-amino acid oxidase-like deaminating enzyme